MGLTKRVYTDYDQNTPITAQNLNDIQQEIINTCSYVICDTAAGTQKKTVALDNFTLVTGSTVKVLFTYTNTASNPSLNVNNTGDKGLYKIDGSRIGTDEATSWKAGYIIDFIYDGSKWIMLGYIPEIGDLSDLSTSEKTDLVSAINEINGGSSYDHNYDTITNGSYCKLPDGTLIQWISGTASSGSDLEITFPTSFYDTSYLASSTVVIEGASSSSIILKAVTRQTGSVKFFFNTSVNSNYPVTIDVVAIGRWK